MSEKMGSLIYDAKVDFRQLEGDLSKIDQKLEQAKRKADQKPIPLRVRPDDAQISNALRQIEQKLGQGKNVKLTADAKDALAAVEKVFQRIDQSKAVKVKVDTSEAERKLNALGQSVQRIGKGGGFSPVAGVGSGLAGSVVTSYAAQSLLTKAGVGAASGSSALAVAGGAALLLQGRQIGQLSQAQATQAGLARQAPAATVANAVALAQQTAVARTKATTNGGGSQVVMTGTGPAVVNNPSTTTTGTAVASTVVANRGNMRAMGGGGGNGPAVGLPPAVTQTLTQAVLSQAGGSGVSGSYGQYTGINPQGGPAMGGPIGPRLPNGSFQAGFAARAFFGGPVVPGGPGGGSMWRQPIRPFGIGAPGGKPPMVGGVVGAAAVAAIVQSGKAEIAYNQRVNANVAGDPNEYIQANLAKADSIDSMLLGLGGVVDYVTGDRRGSAMKNMAEVELTKKKTEQRQGFRSELSGLRSSALSMSDNASSQLAAVDESRTEQKQALRDRMVKVREERGREADALDTKASEANERKWYKLWYRTDSQEAEADMYSRDARALRDRNGKEITAQEKALNDAADKVANMQRAAIQRKESATNYGLDQGLRASAISLDDHLGSQIEGIKGNYGSQIMATDNVGVRTRLDAQMRQDISNVRTQFGRDTYSLNRENAIGAGVLNQTQLGNAGLNYRAAQQGVYNQINQNEEERRKALVGLNANDPLQRSRINEINTGANQRNAGLNSDLKRLAEDFAQSLKQLDMAAQSSATAISATGGAYRAAVQELEAARDQANYKQDPEVVQRNNTLFNVRRQALAQDFAQNQRQLDFSINSAQENLKGNAYNSAKANLDAARERANFRQDPEIVARNNKLFDLQDKILQREQGRSNYVYARQTQSVYSTAKQQGYANDLKPMQAEIQGVQDEITSQINTVDPDQPGSNERIKALKALGAEKLRGIKRMYDGSRGGFAQVQGDYIKFGALKENEDRSEIDKKMGEAEKAIAGADNKGFKDAAGLANGADPKVLAVLEVIARNTARGGVGP